MYQNDCAMSAKHLLKPFPVLPPFWANEHNGHVGHNIKQDFVRKHLGQIISFPMYCLHKGTVTKHCYDCLKNTHKHSLTQLFVENR